MYFCRDWEEKETIRMADKRCFQNQENRDERTEFSLWAIYLIFLIDDDDQILVATATHVFVPESGTTYTISFREFTHAWGE